MKKTIKIRIEINDYTTETDFNIIRNAILASIVLYNNTVSRTRMVDVKDFWYAHK